MNPLRPYLKAILNPIIRRLPGSVQTAIQRFRGRPEISFIGSYSRLARLRKQFPRYSWRVPRPRWLTPQAGASDPRSRQPDERLPGSKPCLAILSPYLPERSHAAAHAAATIQALARHATVDVFTPTRRPRPAPWVRRFHPLSALPALRNDYDHVIASLASHPAHAGILQFHEQLGGACLLHTGCLGEVFAQEHGLRGLMKRAGRGLGRRISIGEAYSWLEDPEQLPTLFWEDLALRSAPLFVHSRFLQQRLEEQQGVSAQYLPPCSLLSFHNQELAAASREARRQRLGFRRDRILIVVPGAIDETTAPLDVLWTLRFLHDWNMPADLHFLGQSGYFREALYPLIDKLKLTAAVSFADGAPTETIYRDSLLGADFALVLTTHLLAETPSGLLDAIAAGLPTVTNESLAFGVDAPSWVGRVPDRLSALLVAEQLMNAYEAGQHRSRGGCDWAEYTRERSVDRYAEQMVNLLQRAVGKPARRFDRSCMMAENAVLFDLSQFLRDPMRSGIQRVAFEIVKHWTGDWPLLPVRFDYHGDLRLLPVETFALMASFFGAGNEDPDAARVKLLWHGWRGERLSLEQVKSYRALLNVELFADECRLEGYYRLLQGGYRDRVFFLVHDLLPWLHPQWFSRATPQGSFPYIRLLREVTHFGFVSPQTQTDVCSRLLRRREPLGRVIAEGSDGLGTAPPQFDPESRRFVYVGLIEPRKNLMPVFDAFEMLWADNVDVELVLAGKRNIEYLREDERIDRLLAEQPRFAWKAGMSDGQVRDLVKSSRAMIYPSLGEGFGLPPLESLALGVPVIVAACVPSLASIDPLGQIRLPVVEAEPIRQAVLSLLDDEVARKKYDEIVQLSLPRWADLGRNLADWLHAEAGSPGSVAAGKAA